MYVISSPSHARIQKVLPEGSYRPASETPFKWRFACVPLVAQHCWLGSLVLFQEIRTTIAMKPYIPVILQGGSGPPPPPLWIRTCFLPGNDLLTNPLIRIFFYFSIKQHVFTYSRKNMLWHLVGRYYVDTIKLILTFEKKKK